MKSKKLVAIILTIIMIAAMIPISATASTATDLATQINAISGLTATVAGNVVTVTGAAAPAPTVSVALNIDSGVTVEWDADLIGSLDRARYILALTGAGTFNLTGTISNDAGGAINITGSGTTLNINGGTIYSASPSAMSVNIAADMVSLNIDASGAITTGGQGSVINVGAGRSGVRIVSSGTIDATVGGNAISDGGVNTQITISSGLVRAVVASAIKSTGESSVATIMGGIVTNAASNNLTPAIDMGVDTGTPGIVYNITIGGDAVVQSTSAAGYAVQTKQSVRVMGNAQVIAINGRAINLVGSSSAAYISGGMVTTTGSGAAISTATTAGVDVTNAQVTVAGGTVSSGSGTAINLTGANSSATVSGSGNVMSGTGIAINVATTCIGTSAVNISGGVVSSTSASAINILAPSTAVNVTGGTVTSTTGNALNLAGAYNIANISGGTISTTVNGNAVNVTAAGTNAQVNVTGGSIAATAVSPAVNAGNAINIAGAASAAQVTINGGQAQVSAMTGMAISATSVAATVTVTAGFVFARGTTLGNVISAPNIQPTGFVGSNAVVCAWNRPQVSEGSTVNYTDGVGTSTDLTLFSQGTAPGTIYWSNNPLLGAGIVYSYGGITGEFFPLVNVSLPVGYGLIFDASSGLLYINDGNATPAPIPGVNWTAIAGSSGTPAQLTLTDFAWVTAINPALDIINGDTTLILHGDNRFETTYYSPFSTSPVIAIRTNNSNLTIEANSSLSAIAPINLRDVTYGYFGIDAGTGVLTINSGEVIARASGIALSAVQMPIRASSAIPGSYYRISSTNLAAVYPIIYGSAPSPFQLPNQRTYMMIEMLQGVSFSAIQIGGASGLADTVAIELTFSEPVTGLTIDNIAIDSIDGVVTKGAIIKSGNGTDTDTVWTIEIARVLVEGFVNVTVSPFGAFFVYPESETVMVYKEILYDLIVTAMRGGTVTGTTSGSYSAGTLIDVTAVPNPGYEFVGWTISDPSGTVPMTTMESMSFPMPILLPGGTVTLTANFLAIITGHDGLIFDSDTGNMYIDYFGDGTIDEDHPFINYQGVLWDGEVGKLTLSGFNWVTDASTALAIVGYTPTIIYLNPDSSNMFESVATPNSLTVTTGIRILSDSVITIDGAGTLSAIGSNEMDGLAAIGFGINLGSSNLTMSGGTFIALGSQAIVWDELNWTGPTLDSNPYRWAMCTNYDAVNPAIGYSWDSPFVYDQTDRYVMLQVMDPTIAPPINGGGGGGAGGGAGTATPPQEQPPSQAPQDEDTEEETTPENGDVSALLNTDRHIRFIRGVGNRLFEPDRSMTRAEVAQMFFNLLRDRNIELTASFPDVTKGAWYERAILSLASIGILTGYPDGSFNPNSAITRAEFVALATRFVSVLPELYYEAPFTDVLPTHWAYEHINAAVLFGWVTGYGDSTFRPARQISRAEAVVITNRMLSRVPDREFISAHEELWQFDDVPPIHWAFFDIIEAATEHDYQRDGGAEHWRE